MYTRFLSTGYSTPQGNTSVMKNDECPLDISVNAKQSSDETLPLLKLKQNQKDPYNSKFDLVLLWVLVSVIYIFFQKCLSVLCLHSSLFLI